MMRSSTAFDTTIFTLENFSAILTNKSSHCLAEYTSYLEPAQVSLGKKPGKTWGEKANILATQAFLGGQKG